MDTEKIIETAAQNAGMPLPLDDKTREFSEGLLSSLGSTLDWVYGRKPPPTGDSDFWSWLDEIQAEAEALPDE